MHGPVSQRSPTQLQKSGQIATLFVLAATLTRAELPEREIQRRLFHDEDLRLFETVLTAALRLPG